MMNGCERHPAEHTRGLTLRALFAASCLCPAIAHAQIATDGTLGPRLTLTGPNYSVTAGIGRASGPNIFHSFSTLNVRTGESLTFLGGSGIANIISRVTGGSASTIDGQIRSTSPGVNLYLLNPSGIFFGPAASLNVAASFYASTASHLVFADGSRFSGGAETVAADSLMPFTSPAGFRFAGASAPITLTGSQLVVQGGNTLGLIGGDVQMTNSGTRFAILSVLGGTAAVAAAGGNADVGIDGRVTRGVANGRLEAVGGTIIAVNESTSGNGGGRIVIRGGDVFFEKAQLLANSRLGNGREIDIDASGVLTLKGTVVNSLTFGKGNAGKITIRANDMIMEDVSAVDTSCDFGCTTGRGGDIDIVVRRNLVMTNDPKQAPQYIVSNSFGGGDTGRVSVTAKTIAMTGATAIQAVALSSGASQGLTVNADAIALSGGAQIDTSSRGSGAGGPMVVNAKDILVRGDRLEGAALANEKDVLSRQSIPSGFFSNAYSSGFAGTISISTGSLQVLDGAEISSSAARRSTGNSGRVSIVATGDVVISGASRLGLNPKASAIVSNTFASGDSGTIEIAADRVRVLDGGLIQTQSEGSGISGEVRIVARDLDVLGGQISSDARAFGRGGSIDIRLSGALTVSRPDPNSFAGIYARTYSAGAGGSIVIRARSALIRDGGEINSGTIGAGAGGNISIKLTDRLNMTTGGSISARSDALADAGNIAIEAGSGIDISGAKILTSAKVADGGNIQIVAGGAMNVVDDSVVSAEVNSGTGSGGNIDIQAGSFSLKSSKLTASSAGGTGGNVSIRSGGTFAANAANISAQVASGIQSGGNILLSGSTLTLAGTKVSANAFSGAGGSVSVQSPGAIAFDKADVTADVASGFGSGGNINVAGGTIALRDSRLSANTFSGSGGSLQVTAAGGMLFDRSRITAQVSADNGIGGSIGVAASTIFLRESVISASAFSGGGGNLTITSPGTIGIDSSRVTAEVLTGRGNGGNLDVNGDALLLRNSAISANAYGGNGGNILIDSQNILTNPASKVTASSELGIDGTVIFSSPAADLSGALFSVSSSFLDATAVVAARCVVPSARARSSLAMRILDPDHQRELGYMFPTQTVENIVPDTKRAAIIDSQWKDASALDFVVRPVVAAHIF